MNAKQPKLFSGDSSHVFYTKIGYARTVDDLRDVLYELIRRLKELEDRIVKQGEEGRLS